MKKLIQKLILRYLLRHNAMFRCNGYVVCLYTKSLYDDVVKPALDYELIRRNRGK